MTRPHQDPWPHIITVAAAKTVDARFRALDHALAATVGHKLFTALVMNWDAMENQRYYSNMPEAFQGRRRQAHQHRHARHGPARRPASRAT
jgi:hypothetical protein